MYSFGGVALDIDFSPTQLHKLGGYRARQTITIRRSTEQPPEEILYHRSDGRYGLSCGKAGSDWIFRSRFSDSFVFSPDRRHIDCHIVSTDDQAWQDVLFRRVLPRITTWYGATAIHAAAIATDDRCLLLLGESGAGKSTLTTFCAMAGWRILSDDMSLLWMDDVPVVEPVQRGMGVWDDVREALSLPISECLPMPGYGGRKWCFRPLDTSVAYPEALSAILILDRSPDIRAPHVSRLAQDELLAILMKQNIPFVAGVQPSAATAMAFGRVATLSRLPGFRLTYPHGYDALPHVEQMLRDMPLGPEV